VQHVRMTIMHICLPIHNVMNFFQSSKNRWLKFSYLSKSWMHFVEHES
jgi:hypothetical protein